LLSDFYLHGEVARMFGVLRLDGYSERALFVIDKRGVIRYVDVHDIDQQPDNEELFRVLAELEPTAASQAAQKAVVEPEPEPAPIADVVLYCTSWCPDCRRARAFLTENSVSFVEIDISRDRTAAQRVRGWANGNETTPTFDIKGKIIVNYNKARLSKELGLD
jgi:glutaredoxin